jgi:hypothetical protein
MSYEHLQQAFLVHQEYIEKNKTKENILVKKIRNLQKNSFDVPILIRGRKRIGKSETSLRIGELFDPDFIDRPKYAVSRKVTWEASAYLRAYNYEKSKSVIILDEPAQSWNHREFMSLVNQVLNKVLIGGGFKEFISPLNLPLIELLDLDAQKLTVFYINIIRRGLAEVFEIIPQKFGGAPIWKKIIQKMVLTRANKELFAIYEEEKIRKQKDLYKKFSRQIEEKEKHRLSNNEIVDMILERPYYFQDNKGNFSVSEIAGEFDIGRDLATKVRAMANKRYEQERQKE